jgi:hypothetical protein
MRRPDPARLDEITAVAEKWLRRCNSQPPEGVLTSRADLRAVLAASTDVAVYDDGTIIWVGAGRQFSAEPVRPPVEQ